MRRNNFQSLLSWKNECTTTCASKLCSATRLMWCVCWRFVEVCGARKSKSKWIRFWGKFRRLRGNRMNESFWGLLSQENSKVCVPMDQIKIDKIRLMQLMPKSCLKIWNLRNNTCYPFRQEGSTTYSNLNSYSNKQRRRFMKFQLKTSPDSWLS